MRAPAVTIGLPVYQGERHLERAISSILDQTFGDFELIISDNGSTDATPDIVAAAAAADDRVRNLRYERNRGASWNFNNCVHEARAPLFKWASHDDQMRPTMLEKCVAAQRKDPDAVLWYPLAVEIDAQGSEVGPLDDALPLAQPQPHERLRLFLEMYKGSNPIFGLLDTSVLRSTRLLEDFHSSDVVLLAELALRGRFVEIEERLFLRLWELRSTHVRTREEVDAWFNPESKRKHAWVRTRLFREVARSITTAPIGPADRLRSLAVLLGTWGPRYWRVMGGEAKIAMRSALGAKTSQ